MITEGSGNSDTVIALTLMLISFEALELYVFNLAVAKILSPSTQAGEIMKLEYQRKVALLNRQKKHNAAIEVLEKTKAAVTHLHTRYIVDMQSMDSTVSEIQHLRDNQLYPRLLDLADR